MLTLGMNVYVYLFSEWFDIWFEYVRVEWIDTYEYTGKFEVFECA